MAGSSAIWQCVSVMASVTGVYITSRVNTFLLFIGEEAANMAAPSGADINRKPNRATCQWLGGESSDNVKTTQRDTRPVHNDDGKNSDNVKTTQRDTRPVHNDDGKNSEQDGEDDDDDDDNSHHNDRNVEDDENDNEVQDNEEDV